MSGDSLNYDLYRFQEAENKAIEALNDRNQNNIKLNADIFSPILQSENENNSAHYVHDERFRLSLNSTNLNPKDIGKSLLPV